MRKERVSGLLNPIVDKVTVQVTLELQDKQPIQIATMISGHDLRVQQVPEHTIGVHLNEIFAALNLAIEEKENARK